MAETYQEMLRRPEWLCRRAEVIRAAGCECEECGLRGEGPYPDRGFQVHHRYYLRGRKPWEYPDDALACLCERCHAGLGLLDEELRFLVGHLDAGDVERLVAHVRRIVVGRIGGPETARKLEAFRAERAAAAKA